MPRLDATVTADQDQAVEQIALERGLSKSAVVSEAIALYTKAILEAKRGRRLVMLDPLNQQPAVELTTPTLTAMEWKQHSQYVEVSPDALQTIQELIDSPAAPTAALREVVTKHRLK